MTLRLVAAFASTLAFSSFLLITKPIKAQTLNRDCYADDPQCVNQLEQLVDQSYQQYRTPPRIIQKRVNSADRACTDNQSSCSEQLQQDASSRQDSEVFQQIRETQQQRLEDSLQ